MLPNGTLETVPIYNEPGTHSVLLPVQPFSQPPQQESNWIVSTSAIKPQKFRVLSMTPSPNDPTKVEITAITYYPQKYAIIEDDLVVEEPITRFTLPTTVSAPRNVRASIEKIMVNGVEVVTLFARWDTPLTDSGDIDPSIKGYTVQWTRTDPTAGWQGTVSTPLREARFENIPASGLYFVRVTAYDLVNDYSQWVVSDAVAIGLPTLVLDYRRRLSILTREP